MTEERSPIDRRDEVKQSRGEALQYNPNDQIATLADLDIQSIDELREEYRWGYERFFKGKEDLFPFAMEAGKVYENLRKCLEQKGISLEDKHFSRTLDWVMDQLERDVGFAFQGHGLGAGANEAILDLDRLLTEGIDPRREFHTANLAYQEGSGARGFIGTTRPFTKGGMLLVSDCRKPLLTNHPITYIILGEKYIRATDALRARYPKYTFVAWHDAPQVLTTRYNEIHGTDIKAVELTEDNRPKLYE